MSPLQDLEYRMKYDEDEDILPPLIIKVSDFVPSCYCGGVPSEEEEKGTDKQDSKRVSFVECDKVNVIRPINEYSNEEVDAMWYTRKEYQAIMRRCEETVQMMERGDALPEENPHYCYRGLVSHVLLS
jgi:hypothetical protein